MSPIHAKNKLSINNPSGRTEFDADEHHTPVT
jgi:hypothetical protein